MECEMTEVETNDDDVIITEDETTKVQIHSPDEHTARDRGSGILRQGLFSVLYLCAFILFGGLVFVFAEDWRFMKSCFFSLTIMTTVGYGSFAPITVGGKVFLVIYSIVTVLTTPIFLNRIANAIIVMMCLPRSSGMSYLPTTDQKLQVGFMCLFLHLFLCGGWAFSLIESWSYWNAVYFSFVTITTIGLGDFAPATMAGQGWCIFFCLTGLGIVTILVEAAFQKYDEIKSK